MRILLPSAVAAAAVAVGVGAYLGRDFAALAAQVTNAATYVLVGISLVPLLMQANRKRSVLAPGLFGIACSSIILFVYGALYIALGRPEWWFSGPPFYVYLIATGTLMASLGHHLAALGSVQGLRALYLALFAFFVAVGFSLAWIVLK